MASGGVGMRMCGGGGGGVVGEGKVVQEPSFLQPLTFLNAVVPHLCLGAPVP